MKKGRLEAFSDGVLAIVITIMVLELKVPHAAEWGALLPILPVLLSYLLSFVYVGIHWNNHHHLLAAARHVDGAVLWANLHLLFWLSLIPFVTGWMGENEFAPVPTAAYGAILFMAAIAYAILQRAILATEPRDSALRRELGADLKGKLSPVLYLAAVAAALWLQPWIACALYVLVALMWIVPDRRSERAARAQPADES
ncbi:MAG: DUF1211 domain-containing protein [Proteobacteria bacterium]|nr:DUF1211 domain-containing protein [Pseudomonadota bacterium]